MIQQNEFGTAHVISVHDNPRPLRFFIPNVLPGDFYIPGIYASPKEVDKLICGVREPGMEKTRYFNYAKLIGKEDKPYILLTIPDGKTVRASVGQQNMDEFGQRLQPDVERAVMTVRAQQIANEFELQFGDIGVVAIKGDEPTKQELEAAYQRNLEWKLKQIAETSHLFPRLGAGIVTEQVVRIASDLYRKGLLGTLPAWANLDLDATAKDMFNCQVCQKPLRKSAIKCDCGAIYDWKKAVDFGLVKLSDVPPAHRKEAGLEKEQVNNV